ncbi:MAG: hypothetical protein ABA06_02030 [Parcubacteria bacterium C7867-001]|nr:MAG: hypothetical protein ABA06_02030 [Parcubacteria bacterium C7867-001]
MGLNKEQALIAIICGAAGILRHTELPKRVVSLKYLKDGRYEITVWKNTDENDWRKLDTEKQFVVGEARQTIEHNSAEAHKCVKRCIGEYEIQNDFVFREFESDSAHKQCHWTLVHHYSLFIRYVAGIGVPISRIFGD